MEVDGNRKDDMAVSPNHSQQTGSHLHDSNSRDDMADSPTNSQQTGTHLHPSISTHRHTRSAVSVWLLRKWRSKWDERNTLQRVMIMVISLNFQKSLLE